MNITDTQIAQLLDDIHTIRQTFTAFGDAAFYTGVPARPLSVAARASEYAVPVGPPAPEPPAAAPLSPVAADIASGRLQPDDQAPAFTD